MITTANRSTGRKFIVGLSVIMFWKVMVVILVFSGFSSGQVTDPTTKCELCYSDECPETDPYCRQKCTGSCPVGFIIAGEASSSVCHPPTTTTSTTTTTTATTATTLTTKSTTTASTTTTTQSLALPFGPAINRRRKRQEPGASSTNTTMQMTTIPEYFCDPCDVIIKSCNVCKHFPVDGKAVCESCVSGYELKNSSCVLIPMHDSDDSGLSVADDGGLSVALSVIIFLIHILARKE